MTLSTNASRFELQLLLAAGFAACLAYPLGVFAPLPMPVRTFLLAFFGPLLGLGSFGLFRALSLNQKSVCGALGAASNAIAGALFVAMILGACPSIRRYRAHGWFGKIYGITGATIAVLLLSLNLWKFPTPPATAGLFDAGPSAACRR